MGRPGLFGTSRRKAIQVFTAGVLMAIAGTVLLAASPAIAACASAGTNCFGQYRGLYAYLNENPGSQLLAELDFDSDDSSSIYNKNRRITGDPNGDRQQIQGRFKDRAPTNGNDVFVTSVWWTNERRCFVSLVALSAGVDGVGVQIGMACNDGGVFQEDGDQDQTVRSGSNTWTYFTTPIQHPLEPSASANKAQIWICEAQAFVPDDCTVNPRVMGVRY
jgi:hypothetical protein